MDGKKLFARTAADSVADSNTGKGAVHCDKLAPPHRARMISIIIPAHNEEDYIGATLDSINRQNYPYFETIVVANGCTDRTALAALEGCHRLVVLSTKSLGIARNLGARLARGEVLMFLDADTILEPGALEIVAHKFSPEYVVGTFKGLPATDSSIFRLIYRVKNFLHRWSLHKGSSGVILCWKTEFLVARGFDESLQIRENSDLIRRLRIFGKYRYLDETSAITSMRRYENRGTGRVLLFWFKIWLLSLVRSLRHREYDTVR